MAPLELGDEGYGEEYEPAHHSKAPREDADCGGSGGASSNRRRAPCATGGAEENSFEEMTMAEIMTGKGDYFPGLVPLIYAYLELIDCDPRTLERVSQYLELIRKRALGELMTPATWMREFVMAHPEYKKDR